MKNKFTEIFTDLFNETELSKSKFAKIIGVDHKRISSYLSGGLPTPQTAIKICDFFKCSVDYIVGLTEEFNYNSIKTNYDFSCFIIEYQKLLNVNKTNHFALSKKGLVNESSLSWWKKGGLPKFEVIIAIAYELGGSIDKMMGRI